MALRRLLLTLLLLPALLLAQSLGFAHAVAHGAGHAPAHAAHAPQAADPAAPTAHGHAHVAGAFDLLFGGHDAGSCRLYDQVTHGDLAVPHVELPPALKPALVALVALEGLALARWAALYDARGPPAAL